MQLLFRILRPMLPMWPWLIATVFCAGIVHLVAVFAVPYLATRDAWARVSSVSENNQLYLLPVANENPILPYMLPDVAYAICRYDLNKNNLLIHTALADSTWNIAISDRYGQNFYFISGAEAKRRELRLLLVPRERLAEEASTEHSEEGDEQIIVVTPNTTGLAVIRAPLRGASFATDTVNVLQGARCVPIALPDPVPQQPVIDQPAPVVQPVKRQQQPQRRPQRRNRRSGGNELPN